jgi:hypothetical protein
LGHHVWVKSKGFLIFYLPDLKASLIISQSDKYAEQQNIGLRNEQAIIADVLC